MTHEEFENEAYDVLKYATEVCKNQGTSYIQSWWLNRRNCPMLDMDTSKINSRLKFLVKKGLLIIDKSNTSTSKGTRYIIINSPTQPKED